jgi:hypothetical protein
MNVYTYASLLSFITWEKRKNKSTHTNANRCLQNEEINPIFQPRIQKLLVCCVKQTSIRYFFPSFCYIAKNKGQWYWWIACLCISSSINELTKRYLADFLCIDAHLSNWKKEKINLLQWSKINAMMFYTSGNVVYRFFSLYIYYHQIFVRVTHTHTQFPSITIWSCYKSHRNPNRKFDGCLWRPNRFLSLRSLTTSTDTRERTSKKKRAKKRKKN